MMVMICSQSNLWITLSSFWLLHKWPFPQSLPEPVDCLVSGFSKIYFAQKPVTNVLLHLSMLYLVSISFPQQCKFHNCVNFSRRQIPSKSWRKTRHSAPTSHRVVNIFSPAAQYLVYQPTFYSFVLYSVKTSKMENFLV